MVTAIIQRKSDGKLLLVKRSDQVQGWPTSSGAEAAKTAHRRCKRSAHPAVPALLRMQVGSYQQYWGGVSGGVEGSESLLHRALQEVRPRAVSGLNHSTTTSARNTCAVCIGSRWYSCVHSCT